MNYTIRTVAVLAPSLPRTMFHYPSFRTWFAFAPFTARSHPADHAPNSLPL